LLYTLLCLVSKQPQYSLDSSDLWYNVQKSWQENALGFLSAGNADAAGPAKIGCTRVDDGGKKVMSDEPRSGFERLQTWTSWGVSSVNGLFGDYLQEQQNGLAIDMAFYHHNRPLRLSGESLTAVYPQLNAKLCVLVHGLGCNEDVWSFHDPLAPTQQTSYGALLQAERGYTPFYLRYNTGLAVADNGKMLACLLKDLLACYPFPVEELMLIGHSMGGLVIRSACHYGVQQQLAWTSQVSRIFYLGTPHDGADLERIAHIATLVLQAVPNPVTKLVGRFFNLRSQGIKDLRFGALSKPDVLDDAPSAPGQHHRRAVPWLSHAQHYLIAGTLTDDPAHPLTTLLGDGLVAAPRPAGQSSPENSDSPIPEDHIKLFPRIHHLQLVRDRSVYQQINDWCASTRNT
jgi:pimeloyl-ACP methyl ester carboxylesterase